MDTAAAAAATVVVDLKPEASGKTPLLSSPLLSKTSFSNSGCECLGSTVEAMSVTPPPTPPALPARSSCDVHVEPISHSAQPETHPSNGLKGKEAAEVAPTPAPTESGQPEREMPATSTSSANASTTPTSALLATSATGTEHQLAAGTATNTLPMACSSSSSDNGDGARADIGHCGSIGGRCSSSAASVCGPNSGPSVDQLLLWQDMPQYLQFNPYVLRGYRPLQTFKGCLLSLFYWHNETINILTHAIPIFYILAIVPGLMPWDSGYKFLSFCHVFGSVAPWCGSFVYHLFMNIEKGENVYYTLLKLDMVGIWVSQSFGALPLVTATTLCFPPVLKWLIIVSYCLLSLWGLYKALTASSPWQRRLCFALPFAMRSILTFLRIRGMVGGSHMALSHVYLQVEVDGVSILGGAIGAMRIPEKWFPGVVDFYLNSHNIMHVLVVVAVYSMHKATIKDFEWMSTQTCNTVANVTEEALGHVEL
nr:progestin and adipoQ receptor family member 4 isoform X1 [Drosophila kikkawai]